MSNWDMQLESARKDGNMHSLYPADFKLPMVAAEDLGMFADRFIMQSINDSKQLQYVEDPE